MSPLKHSTNVAARMGRWSAKHRKTAIFGWLAFVIASFAIGGAVGMKTIDPNDYERRRGTKGRPHHPRRRLQAGRADGVRPRSVPDHDGGRPGVPRGRDRGHREARRVPAGREGALAACRRQRGPDLRGRPRRADSVQPEGLVRGGNVVHRHDRRRHGPGPEGEPRLHRRPGRLRVDRQGSRRDVRLAARPRRDDLDPDHPRHPAARLRLAGRGIDPARARTDRSVRDDGPRRPPQPDRADGRIDLGGHPPDRPRRRCRLLAVLHPP